MSNYIDEFRNSEEALRLGKLLSSYQGPPINIMEVCGTHTMAIFRYGIRDLLPENIRLVSGPGCPVCVTPIFYVNAAIALAKTPGVIITTFGDMMRVPGSSSSLLREKADGADVRIVYSPLDALGIARGNPEKKVVFLSIGFETTTPIAALTVLHAQAAGARNFSVLSANKTIPEALRILASDPAVQVDGFLYPGHVSAVTGTGLYEMIAREYGIPGIVSGFEPLDMIHGILSLARNIRQKKCIVENQYSRLVPAEGNPIAVEKMYRVFEPADAVWRGIGTIPGSGLKMRETYAAYDAWRVFDLDTQTGEEPKGCLCGEVLKGTRTPGQCPLYKKKCTPENPVGACMVSSEGTCAAYFKYSNE